MMKRVIALILTGGVLLAAGCSRSPRISFYTLAATAPQESPASLRLLPAIAVAAVTLPEFVDRAQLVIVAADNRVDIFEQHQWAESLKSAIPRIIADNLSRQLGTDRVAAYPQHAGDDAAFTVSVDFQRFESSADSVSLDALWKISTPDNKSFTGRSRVREARAQGLDNVAAAYSRALAAVCADIAQSIRKELIP